jgi:hypothetical protein
MTRLQRLRLPTASQLLERLFENPKLVGAVRELPGPILGKLIDKVGLEDAADLVALATTQQLESVFDEDLWHAGADGWEEHFDPARFALWLHAFGEAGEDSVIARLVELPIDLVTLSVHRLVLVLNIDSIAIEMSNSGEDLDQVEKALDSCLYEEWEEFRLIARNDSAWDDIIQALFSLDREHHALLRKILEQCEAMSSEWIEDNGGLYAVLTSDEMLESDMRAERDDRRAQKGYVSPADARAFLELARGASSDPSVRDPITNAYFRSLERTFAKEPAPGRAVRRAPTKSSNRVRSLIKLLEEANVIEAVGSKCQPKQPSRQPARLPGKRVGHTEVERGGAGAESPDLPARLPGKRVSHTEVEQTGASAEPLPRLLDHALASLREVNPVCYGERMEELSYLANVLVAAPQNRRRRLRPVEALELALTTTNRGLELTMGSGRGRPRAELLRAASGVLETTTADRLFRLGYREGHAQAQDSKVSAVPKREGP